VSGGTPSHILAHFISLVSLLCAILVDLVFFTSAKEVMFSRCLLPGLFKNSTYLHKIWW